MYYSKDEIVVVFFFFVASLVLFCFDGLCLERCTGIRESVDSSWVFQVHVSASF